MTPPTKRPPWRVAAETEGGAALSGTPRWGQPALPVLAVAALRPSGTNVVAAAGSIAHVWIEAASQNDLDDLAALLVDAVDAGACVGFLNGLALGHARSFWQAALDGAQTWVVRLRPDGQAVGVVQLHVPKLPNGRHRAEVAKLLVHRSARRRGLARALMEMVEQQAERDGRWLLQLDTETGSAAESLYVRLGWQVLGVIPDHAVRPDGDLAQTTFLYKRLGEEKQG